MKLTKEDKELLKSWGESEEDFNQIEETMNGCEFDLHDEEGYSSKKISRQKVLELLDRETFLSGIVRCAFHMTASREIGTSKKYIGFDNGKLWRKWFY